MKLLKKTIITFIFLYLLSVCYAYSQTTPRALATWDAVTTPGAGYNIYRSLNPDGSASVKLNSTILTVTTYTDTTLVATTTYYYYVTALKASDGTGESGKSNIVRFNWSENVFSAPTNFVIKP